MLEAWQHTGFKEYFHKAICFGLQHPGIFYVARGDGIPDTDIDITDMPIPDYILLDSRKAASSLFW